MAPKPKKVDAPASARKESPDKRPKAAGKGSVKKTKKTKKLTKAGKDGEVIEEVIEEVEVDGEFAAEPTAAPSVAPSVAPAVDPAAASTAQLEADSRVLQLAEQSAAEGDTGTAGPAAATSAAPSDAAAVVAPPASSQPTQPATAELMALLPQLKEAERAVRADRAKALDMSALVALEADISALLDQLPPYAIAEIAPTVASLLDAGSNDFVGSRGTAGMRVHSAARTALSRMLKDGSTSDGSAAGIEALVVNEVNAMSRQVSAFTAAGHLGRWSRPALHSALPSLSRARSRSLSLSLALALSLSRTLSLSLARSRSLSPSSLSLLTCRHQAFDRTHQI